MHSALQAPLLLPIAPDLPRLLLTEGWKRDREGRGSAGDEASFGFPGGSPVPLPAGGLIMAASPVPRRRFGAFGEGVVISALALPLAQTMASTSRPACPLHSFPWAPALGLWGPTGPSSSLQWPPLGPSSHPKALLQSRPLMQARAAFAFSFQLRGSASLYSPAGWSQRLDTLSWCPEL